MGKPSSRGRIKSFDPERWVGVIESRGIPGDISVSSSVVESSGNGLQELVKGEQIEFRSPRPLPRRCRTEPPGFVAHHVEAG
jgi:cold shock CspA family protein